MGTLIDPLTAGLEIAVQTQSSHLWSLLRSICTELLEIYGDHDLDLGEEIGAQRLKFAVIYFLAAIKISNQEFRFMRNRVGLYEHPTFTTPPPDELLHLITNMSSSSATPDPEEEHRLAAAAEADAAAAAKAPPAKGAKGGKGDKKAAAGAGAGDGDRIVPGGRDALHMLFSLFKECDPLWLCSSEAFACADIHSLLRTTYSFYNSQCCLSECPSPESTVEVPNSSVSTLFIFTKTPDAFAAVLERQPNDFDYETSGLYSHVSIFFLLGDAVLPTATATTSGATTGNSKEPILTKLVLPREDCTYIEKTLREIRFRMMDTESKKFQKPRRVCQYEFGDVLVLLLGLLKNGIITQDKQVTEKAEKTEKTEKTKKTESEQTSTVEKLYKITEKRKVTGRQKYKVAGKWWFSSELLLCEEDIITLRGPSKPKQVLKKLGKKSALGSKWEIREFDIHTMTFAQ